jgi:hypothetical protein
LLSAKANSGLWQLAQLTELSLERVGSKNKASPKSVSVTKMVSSVEFLQDATINKASIKKCEDFMFFKILNDKFGLILDIFIK